MTPASLRQLMWSNSFIADAPSEIAIFNPLCSPEVIKADIRRLYKTSREELHRPEGPVEVYNESYVACADASAVLILTDCDQFRYPLAGVPRSPF
jgi:UDPglucose 6-dehydrogenase